MRKPDKLKTVETCNRVLSMRRAGHTYDEIASTIGIPRACAYQIVTKHLKECREQCAETASELRQLQLDSLSQVRARVIVRANEEPPHLPSVDRLLRIDERIAGLMGLDTKQVTVKEDANNKIYVGINMEDI